MKYFHQLWLLLILVLTATPVADASQVHALRLVDAAVSPVHAKPAFAPRAISPRRAEHASTAKGRDRRAAPGGEGASPGLGQTLGGVALILEGVTEMGLGGGLSVLSAPVGGVGAIVGAPVAVHGAHTFVNGLTGIGSGLWAMSKGTPPGPSTSSAGGTPGPSGRVSTAKFLEKRWDKATFPSVQKSVDYHVAKHGKGLGAVEYTQRAMQAFGDGGAVRKAATDMLGRDAVKVTSEFGSGLFTPQGKAIWFHPAP